MDQLYFAYGSNLCTIDWNAWCDRHGHCGSGLRAVGVATLPKHRLHFSHYSSARGGGALNVLPSPAHAVSGVVMEADEATWEALTRKEGAPHVYEAIEMDVLDAKGKPVAAIVYVLRAERVREFVPPTDAYVEAVCRGLQFFGLPTDAVIAARENLLPP